MTPIKRVNYFTGQLLNAADFQAEQDYHREKQRLHNRLLLGLGIVGGLKVSLGKGDRAGRVVVAPGSAMDPTDELIQLCEAGSLSLKSSAAAVRIYLRHTERPADALPATNPNATSQPSRIEEGAELVLVDEAPPATAAARRVAADPTGVALARLVRTRTGWRVDRNFKVARV